MLVAVWFKKYKWETNLPALFIFFKSSLPFQVDAPFTERSDGKKVSAQAEFYRVFVQFIWERIH